MYLRIPHNTQCHISFEGTVIAVRIVELRNINRTHAGDYFLFVPDPTLIKPVTITLVVHCK